jgi:DNA-directed RNA polymerase specialized sigma24 family protein
VSVNAQRQLKPLDAEAIWEDFDARLLGFIARRVPDRDSAEDILQDVMLRIHRRAAELEHAPAVGAWVHQIARNAIADHYRRAPVCRERPAGIDLDPEEQPVPERDPDGASQRARRVPGSTAETAPRDPPEGSR